MEKSFRNNVVQYAHICDYGMFTLDVCVCICVNSTVKFNIVSMETQIQTHRMGLNPFCAFSIDAMLNLTVTLMQTQTHTSSVNIALMLNLTSRNVQIRQFQQRFPIYLTIATQLLDYYKFRLCCGIKIFAFVK